MSSRGTSYNERSWAIDLIGHLNGLAGQVNRSIKSAGGEKTIKAAGGKRLFPDVLLFGDRSQSRILQGWELKLPDTGIDDVAFRENAEEKARALGLDSFILWNVSCAHLYVLKPGSKRFKLESTWSDLSDITDRAAVEANRERWEAMASEIFNYLNDMFDRGSLQGRPFIEAYKAGGITELIMENSGSVDEALKDAVKRDEQLRNEINLWENRYKDEYSQGESGKTLAQVILSDWVGKILLGNILRETDERARLVSEITGETTPEQALELFDKLSEACNFQQIFSKNIGLHVVPEDTWNQLVQLNSLLSELRLGSVDHNQIGHILEAAVEVTVRKLRGQYVTPVGLSRLLVSLCLRNIVDDRVFDPFCGSGTIVRAALEKKLAAGAPEEQASASVMASDRDFQAVQLTTFALARPKLMHIPLRVFRSNAFDLHPGAALEFHHPTDGHTFSEVLEPFDAITSNLPFVSQKGRKGYKPEINKVSNMLREGEARLSGHSDLSAYIPFLLHPLLKDGGRLGIIITNAWLGANWGEAFHELLTQYYDIRAVITSGSEKWFKSSKVVANILILEKKPSPSSMRNNVNFVVLERPLAEMADDRVVDLVTAQIQSEKTQDGMVTINSVTPSNLARFRGFGLGGNAQFVNCDWVLDIPQPVPLRNLFKIRRGARRGCNDLFYPKPGHGIEMEYIKPLVKGPDDFERLVCSAKHEAFSCNRNEDDLKAQGHTGALNWIRNFKTPDNVKKLSRKNLLWYQMNTDDQTDLVMFINYGDRLFVGRVDPPAFADQRLVRLMPLSRVDMDLCHALLNCTISMFFMEGMGFGRGLGALDLNKDRIENFFHILDPSLLSKAHIRKIKNAFAPILRRNILGVKEELEQEDRRQFDQVVMDAFGLNMDRELIYQSLASLVEIRQSSRRGNQSPSKVGVSHQG